MAGVVARHLGDLFLGFHMKIVLFPKRATYFACYHYHGVIVRILLGNELWNGPYYSPTAHGKGDSPVSQASLPSLDPLFSRISGINVYCAIAAYDGGMRRFLQ
jgi:hypothetical protein